MTTIASKLELAIGADISINSGGWAYTDYSSYALDKVKPSWGRIDEASTMQPAPFTCKLNNADGRFTYLQCGTPIRYSINPGTGYTLLYQGFVSEVTPVWPAGNSQVAHVLIAARGTLDILQQGAAITQSAIYRSTVRAPGVVSYAPMEDDAGTTTVFVQAPTQQKVLLSGALTFAGETTLAGAKQAAVLTATSYLGLQTYGYKQDFGGHWQVDWFAKFTGSDPAAETILMRSWAPSGPVNFVDVVYGGGNWGIRVYGPAGALGSSIFSPPAGQATGWWHWRIMAHDAGGGGTEYKLTVFPASGVGSFTTVTIASTTPGNVSICTVLPQAGLVGVAMCHWVIYDQFDFLDIDLSAKNAYDGENAITRLKRLCKEESIQIAVTGSSSVTMGPQKPGAILSLLRDCEAADGGILYDGYTGGLSYLSEQSRYNRTPTLALNADLAQVKVPFQPVKNRQNLRNDWTLSNPDGDSAHFSDEVNVKANGRITDTGTVNLADADQLYQLASWKTHLTTVPDLRLPQLELELIDHPELWSSVLALRPGYWVTADNLLDQFPPGQLGVIAEGIGMTIDATSWRVTINCSPSSPWDTGVLSTDPLDCGASVLASTPTASSTTIDVAVSDGCLWSVSDGPFNITVKGTELAPPEIMTVTAVSAAVTSTPALVAVGTAAATNAAPATPGLPGGATAAGNLLLMLASVRDTNAVTTDMYVSGAPGWEKIADYVQAALFAKIHSGSEVAPTVNYRSDITGDTVIAQIASFSGKWGDPKSQLIASAASFNASAQDINYPGISVPLDGALIIWWGWKADDWTSVATLGGVTEISEATSTLGNDAGIVWDTNNTAWAAGPVSSGSFTVTGGTSQISRGGVLALRTVYQTLTVTRGQAGTTARAHNLGEEVHTTNALTLARQ